MSALSSGCPDALGHTDVLAKGVVLSPLYRGRLLREALGLSYLSLLMTRAPCLLPKPVGRNLHARRAPPAIRQGRLPLSGS